MTATFDFETVVDRRNTNAMKWTVPAGLLPADVSADDILPMWVADMDFRVAPAIISALQAQVDHGVFGYANGADPAYVAAVTGWQARRFGWQVPADWVMPVASVVAALKMVIQTVTRPGDSVLIQTPVYHHFHADPLSNGRSLAYAPLTLDGDRYRFDPVAFEQAIRPDTRLFILSHPHNPTGNVWSESDLRAMGEICLRHGVFVIADEIHADFVLADGMKHIPFASLDPRFAANSVTCTSASKTFNLAGLQCGTVFVSDPVLRRELKRTLERNTTTSPNQMGMVATAAAYTGGEGWADAMLATVRDNQAFFAEAVNSRCGGLRALPMDSLYLAWMDCRGTGLSVTDLDAALFRAGLWLDRGPKFGSDAHGFVRVNLGCPRSVVEEAVRRLEKAFPKG
ncbi:MalY/PatB family protein [Novispirillum itersonii]|uniref:cysteine-S-conjugate beta-lyase n=1 Tax=Novispirillum itersonii TaxID=189 RepID=A0A7W9ZHC4_NOVIT|nr:MalY/PatB family protein [Novispirillum itersonii]MBB6211078.1 cystathionine beta-lyase [Novispirillum itersonii]